MAVTARGRTEVLPMRLIDADKIQWKSYPNDYGETNDDYVEKCDIDNMPTVDAVPVVHGRWIRPHWKNNNYCCDCSECGGEAMHRDYQWDKNGVYPICPNCGAMMDGGIVNGR